MEETMNKKLSMPFRMLNLAAALFTGLTTIGIVLSFSYNEASAAYLFLCDASSSEGGCADGNNTDRKDHDGNVIATDNSILFSKYNFEGGFFIKYPTDYFLAYQSAPGLLPYFPGPTDFISGHLIPEGDPIYFKGLWSDNGDTSFVNSAVTIAFLENGSQYVSDVLSYEYSHTDGTFFDGSPGHFALLQGFVLSFLDDATPRTVEQLIAEGILPASGTRQVVEDGGVYNFDNGNTIMARFQSGTEVVPLPAALPLFASGLGVMAWMARRRKRGQVAHA